MKYIGTEEYYNNCPHVCYSRARGFESKEPVPTCRRFHSNYEDPNLRGTFEKCCDVAITGRCIIPEAEETEKQKIKLMVLEHQKEIEKRKQLKQYDTRRI